jgi:hypothetical protein
MSKYLILANIMKNFMFIPILNQRGNKILDPGSSLGSKNTYNWRVFDI